MAGKGKRVPVTAAPGPAKTGATAPVPVSAPVEEFEQPVIAVDEAIPGAGKSVVVIFNHGRQALEMSTATALQQGVATEVLTNDPEQVLHNIRQMNQLAGWDALQVLDQAEQEPK